MSTTAKEILKTARNWIGKREIDNSYLEIMNVYNSHKPLARGYAIKPKDSWCDCFVSACAIVCNATDIIGTEVGVQKHVDIFKSKGIWIEDGTITPRPGDIIVFNWDDKTQPNDGRGDHIGYVEYVRNGKIVCIEGNKNNAVERRSIPIGWGFIRGFARPHYQHVTSKKKSVDTIAREVINGTWGNGDKRKAMLISAGYDYKEVQAKVNELLS